MKDHFAGSVAAMELLNHLISSHRGMTHEQFFIRMRDEVAEDQEVLRGLLHDLDAEGGALRNTTAFLSEKFARIKLLLENPAGGQLARLEKLEAPALGIEGKRTLWRTLHAVAEEIAALRKVDFARLDQRADDQSKRVEARRIEAARDAFLPAKSGG
jgi:predicted DNA-binding ribbon-helix-helix protein